MEERILIQQFREAWLDMDINTISSFMADSMTFSSLATFSSFNKKQEFLEHASRVFNKLKRLQVSTIPRPGCNKASFALTYRFETLVPVPYYMITNEGFGLVSCLEYRFVNLETVVKLSFKEQLISKIKVFQKEIIECRKTA